ncbi:protein of unknown function DUF29 [Gloeothece citriformis PCC 7424]|uniref:DUF29 domain-containing protein n=1 Tax=Gloeothece citriformis (strain PCC 7424) TaxID=65393 RepID=B7KJK6_GLOC7|nr:DUF29 domain-containing protein [Gloeothece citriformis]ACK73683.1 protein of unknown function DUF29 [Gloeothece citriformis PCC 7424]
MDKTLYNQDYYLWLDTTAQLLKEGKFSDLDVENLLEEIVSLKLQERQAIREHLTIVLSHLLQYKYQSEHRTNNCRLVLFQHRDELDQYLNDSPSLKSFFREVFDECYDTAKRLAAIETDLPRETFPPDTPFKLEQVLDTEYLPE